MVMRRMAWPRRRSVPQAAGMRCSGTPGQLAISLGVGGGAGVQGAQQLAQRLLAELPPRGRVIPWYWGAAHEVSLPVCIEGVTSAAALRGAKQWGGHVMAAVARESWR